MTNQLLQEICCSIGYPMAGNPAQYMMEKAFARAGLDWRYLTLEVPQELLEDAVRGMRALGFRGGNFADPHRRRAVGCLDELTDVARLAGAVDCFYRRGGSLVGEMTVGAAVAALVRERIEPAGKRLLVLGSGSAARAVALELAAAGVAEVTVVNRTETSAEDLATMITNHRGVTASFALLGDCLTLPEATDIVVQATPLGMETGGQELPVDAGGLREGLLVVDLASYPGETRLLREARERGCAAVDGLSVMVACARVAFRLWTDMEADAATMRESLEEFLGL